MNKTTKTSVLAVKPAKNKPVYSGESKPEASVNTRCLARSRQTLCRADSEFRGYMDLYVRRRKR